MRVTRQQIYDAIKRINTVHKVNIEADSAYGQLRIVTNGGSRNLSPRLPTSQLKLWLEGYEAGLDTFYNQKIAIRELADSALRADCGSIYVDKALQSIKQHADRLFNTVHGKRD